MPSFDRDMLAAAQRLLARRTGQRGKLPSARIRRSISTTYYTLFHFLTEEAARDLVGAHNDLRRRRRTLARVFTHNGTRIALEKVRGTNVDPGVADLLRPRRCGHGAVPSPAFARAMARTFTELQGLRNEADYDLNKDFVAADATALIARVQEVIAEWRSADAQADQDFKQALSVLMLLRGQLRRDA